MQLLSRMGLMGTNYYLAAPHLADHFDDGERGVHIGKSSAGWKFGWRGHPALGIKSKDDWFHLFRNCGDAMIVDEYRAMVTFSQFEDICDDEIRQMRRDDALARVGKPGEPLLARLEAHHGNNYTIYPGYYADEQGCEFLDVEFF